MRMDLSKWIAASALVLSAPLAHGFVAPKAAPEFTKNAGVSIGQKVVRPDLVKAAPYAFAGLKGLSDVRVETDAVTNAVRLISGGELLAHRSLKGANDVNEFVAVAMDYLRAHPEVFGVTAEDLVLNEKAVLIDKDVQFLKFNVKRDGVLISDAHIDFRFKQGKLLQVANASYSEARLTESRSAVSNSQMESAVASALIAEKVTAQGEKLRVVAEKQGYRLVRVAQFVANTATEKYIAQVDMATGKVFEIAPTVFRLQGSAAGHVHPRWYNDAVTSVPYYDLTLNYTGGTVTTDMNGDFVNAPDTAQPALNGFTGTRIKVVASTGTAPSIQGARVRESWLVRYEKGTTEAVYADKAMAHSMAYAHLNDQIRYAKRYISTPWLDAQLRVNVNLADTCNAHWDGSTVNLYSAGGGCANTGLISDVFFHEWGHGLDDNTGGIEDGAYSEGFGDIMSLAMTHSNVLGIGFEYPSLEPVRDLAPNKVYPADRGEVHAEGLIIAGTFWDLFDYLRQQQGEAVAGDLISKYAFKVIFTASRYTDVYNALLVIDDNNGDLNDQTPNYCIINKAFAEHGLAVADQACSLAAIDAFQVDDSAGNSNGIVEPGESIKLYATARNSAPTDLNGLHGVLSVSGVAGVTVSQAQMDWDMIPSRGAGLSTTPAEITVGNDVACGSSFVATVNLAADTRTAIATSNFTVGRLVGTESAYAAAGLPIAITDNNSIYANLNVNGNDWDATTKVQAARLKFDLTHTYVGDLTISLVSPAGVEKQVYRGSGSGDDVHFDQDVSALVAGLPGAGQWKLKVTDNASQDVGSLTAAMIKLTPAVFECR